MHGSSRLIEMRRFRLFDSILIICGLFAVFPSVDGSSIPAGVDVKKSDPELGELTDKSTEGCSSAFSKLVVSFLSGYVVPEDADPDTSVEGFISAIKSDSGTESLRRQLVQECKLNEKSWRDVTFTYMSKLAAEELAKTIYLVSVALEPSPLRFQIITKSIFGLLSQEAKMRARVLYNKAATASGGPFIRADVIDCRSPPTGLPDNSSYGESEGNYLGGLYRFLAQGVQCDWNKTAKEPEKKRYYSASNDASLTLSDSKTRQLTAEAAKAAAIAAQEKAFMDHMLKVSSIVSEQGTAGVMVATLVQVLTTYIELVQRMIAHSVTLMEEQEKTKILMKQIMQSIKLVTSRT